MINIKVQASGSYDVILSPGILRKAGEQIRQTCGGSVCAVVTDDLVDRLYFGKLKDSMTGSGYRVVKFVVAHGEQSKNADNYIALLNFLSCSGVTRFDVVAALGGGVVGDLAGFAAATYMRGIQLVQLPTTLLACVDSSVGGKTAINLASGKNLAGAFYQPSLVLCDSLVLDTLSSDIYKDGCAEVIKYGVIADKALFEMLKEPIQPRIAEIIARCITIKRDIVVKDERELGLRKLLNFGHTVGHALESLSGFGISHGRAVAVGMAVITRASYRNGLCGRDTADELLSVLQRHELPDKTRYSADDIAKAALSDKKRKAGQIDLIVPSSIGQCEVEACPVGELKAFIASGLE
ncbi:MAG: 3-dehydroquinate synthase [Clostridiales bacterium]|jgi:3-dehydroquinate synthase|nr:3-dehydroquinate synthase [Clostridiales bacterium]